MDRYPLPDNATNSETSSTERHQSWLQIRKELSFRVLSMILLRLPSQISKTKALLQVTVCIELKLPKGRLPMNRYLTGFLGDLFSIPSARSTQVVCVYPLLRDLTKMVRDSPQARSNRHGRWMAFTESGTASNPMVIRIYILYKNTLFKRVFMPEPSQKTTQLIIPDNTLLKAKTIPS